MHKITVFEFYFNHDLINFSYTDTKSQVTIATLITKIIQYFQKFAVSHNTY